MAPTKAAPTTLVRTAPDLSFLLDHTSHVLATRMAAAFAEIGSTPRAYCVLMHALAGEYTQIELAAMTDLDKTTMVVTLDELEAAGHAERHPSPTDRRARIVRVTPAGRKAAEIGAATADRVHREALEELAPRQREAFLDALQSLAQGPLAEPVESRPLVRRARRARQPAG
jgi:MarR family transcriptional regulator, transcriptional regulator for hemolysin